MFMLHVRKRGLSVGTRNVEQDLINVAKCWPSCAKCWPTTIGQLSAKCLTNVDKDDSLFCFCWQVWDRVFVDIAVHDPHLEGRRVRGAALQGEDLPEVGDALR